LFLKGLITFAFIIITYKGSNISAKFKPELVTKKALIKAVFSEIASFS
jgi:hypothetical protein